MLSLCLMIASGYDRPESLEKQDGRLELLLHSIKRNTSEKIDEILVCDDYSENYDMQQKCRTVCEGYGVRYILKPSPWVGPCGNYNNAVREAKNEYVAMLGDDQFCSRGWWEPIPYFIHANKDLKWGMLGWSVIFAEDMVRAGIIPSKETFYAEPEVMWRIGAGAIPKVAITSNWCNWDRPRFRGCCSGTAFVIRRSLWERFGGFHEELYQFDEDYGDNVWNVTDHYCIQIPTPPIYHYGGASGWPPWKGAGDERWRKGWETRPLVPVKFEDRGKTATKVIEKTGELELENVKWKPLVLDNTEYAYQGKVVDLGCGKNLRHPDAIGIDIVGKPASDAEIVCNLGFDLIPIESNSCRLVMAHDVLEHIPFVVWDGKERKLPMVKLFNEVSRILKVGGIFEIAVPFYPSPEIFQDPTHASIWTQFTIYYFADTYYGFKELYGHTSNFLIKEVFVDGAHLQIRLVKGASDAKRV